MSGMRVIEPKNDLRRPSKKPKSKKRPVRTISSLIVLVGLSLVFLAIANDKYKTAIESEQPSRTSSANTTQELEKVAGAKDMKFKFFTGDQFQDLYEDTLYPNVQTILTSPAITGNSAADKRIRTIAASRGYLIRSVPVRPIVKIEGINDNEALLQPKSYQAWQVLEDEAKKDNIPLRLNSAYRSIERQKQLFLDRLNASGVSVAQIAAGQADSAVVNVLQQAAPPGYSRHHTGYTIDLVCGAGNVSFKSSSCFGWLKTNNYEHAKRAGWVPSYPEGVDDQGPEPEPWEYVWVGLAPLVEQ